MANLIPHAENEIEADNNIDIDEEMEEDDSFYDDDDSDATSLIVLIPDENGEPPLRVVEVPADFDDDGIFDVAKDGDMPQDFMSASDDEIEELLCNAGRVKALKRKIKNKGRHTLRKLTFRCRWKNRSDSTSRIRSRSPRKRLTLTPSKTRPET